MNRRLISSVFVLGAMIALAAPAPAAAQPAPTPQPTRTPGSGRPRLSDVTAVDRVATTCPARRQAARAGAWRPVRRPT
ncbi:MAG: hypothetical protein U0470_09195 [Anaerolineae bacterium]